MIRDKEEIKKEIAKLEERLNILNMQLVDKVQFKDINGNNYFIFNGNTFVKCGNGSSRAYCLNEESVYDFSEKAMVKLIDNPHSYTKCVNDLDINCIFCYKGKSYKYLEKYHHSENCIVHYALAYNNTISIFYGDEFVTVYK